MRISYNPLWKLLIDRKLKKHNLCARAGVCSATITKMGKDAHISTDTLEKICNALECDLTDIMELVEE